MPGKKFDPSRAAHLDSPMRRKFIDPEKIILTIGVRKGMAVADIGSGTGFFTLPLAKAVGAEGKVFAVDISAELLEVVKGKTRGMGNMETILSTEDKIPLPDRSIDIALMVNVLHELEGDGTLREIGRILRPGGALAVIDWKKKLMLEGPPLWHRLSEKEAEGRLSGIGFKPEKRFEPSHFEYGLVLRL